MATQVRNNNPFWGMIIYNISGDGTLHGDWKNNRLSNDSILGEIARKRNNNSDFEGEYNVVWIEEDRRSHNAILCISAIENNTAWLFTWTRRNVEIFRGRGMNIGQSQIAVIYWASEDGGLTFQ